nr:hypothetical protein [Tanacetum cinerariifolium]
MVKTSSSSENEPCCSKSCKKDTDSLNSKITELTDKLGDRKNMMFHYKVGLAQVEARLAEHRNRELKYCEKSRVLEFKVESRDNCIESLTKELELIKKEKKGLDSKLAGFQRASKDLDNLLESQRSDKNKEGLGYSAVPLSYSSLLSSQEGYVLDKIARTKKIKIDKGETVKKPAVKYAKLYRKPSKGVKKGRTCPTNTHKSIPSRPSTHRPQMRTTRPHINVAQPKRTPVINQHIHILAGMFKENQQSELNLKFQGFPLFVAAAQDKLILLDQRDKIGRFSEDKK